MANKHYTGTNTPQIKQLYPEWLYPDWMLGGSIVNTKPQNLTSFKRKKQALTDKS